MDDAVDDAVDDVQVEDVALLVNPTAGKGRASRVADVVLPHLRAGGARPRVLSGSSAEESADLAAQAVADGVDALVVVGGDGLVNVALQAVAGTGVSLGVVPAGTGNDLGRYLGVSRSDPLAATLKIMRGRTRRIDLARTGGRYFVTILSAGFDAVVNERANAMSWPKGQMRYNLATVAELRTFTPLRYTLEVDGVERRTEAMLVAVANGPSFGGGLRIAEGADLGDGLLDVVLIKPMSKPELLRTYPKLFRGTHTDHRCFERVRGSRVTVAAPGIVAYADGERFGPLPLTVESVPGALRVLT